jgi:hypothetical protein
MLKIYIHTVQYNLKKGRNEIEIWKVYIKSTLDVNFVSKYMNAIACFSLFSGMTANLCVVKKKRTQVKDISWKRDEGELRREGLAPCGHGSECRLGQRSSQRVHLWLRNKNML